MIATLCFLFAVLTIAYLESGTDAARIADYKPIDHGKELKERVIAVLVCGALICLAFNAWEWRTLYWLPMAWGLFTPSFRWWLNRKRGKDWRYVSPSNVYDWFFIRLTWAGVDGYREEAIELHSERYGLAGFAYRKDLHRAGTIAYITEALVFAAAFTAFTLA